ncbi:unnamed protein product [Mesocestoides corti]|uniref:Uncharacterized protein n=1 Tax=Mesocestoides corti TaxID=53468 RepID=A0A0R3U4C7_MESCO|nr:unnamed protein product [Mesocestoides corti]
MPSMFISFQSALKEVFAVTVQKEEELNCQTAAIALGKPIIGAQECKLWFVWARPFSAWKFITQFGCDVDAYFAFTACLLQKYAFTPRFATHRQCLASFGERTPGASTQRRSPTALELANAGFFHTGRGDEAVCGACFLGLRDWQPSDVDAEAVHARFAGAGHCLYLLTRRLLTSVLPLARKRLSPVNAPPQPDVDDVIDRLGVIAREISGRNDSCWPVENARALGYSDDLIALALWRLQAEKKVDQASRPVWTIDPQGTASLLKAILRVQESGLGDEETADNDNEEEGEAEEEKEGSECGGEGSSPLEDAELVGLSRRKLTAPPKPRLPCLSQMLQWWAETWLTKPPLRAPGVPAVVRRKANSTSA